MLANSSNPVHELRPGQDLPHLAGVGTSLPQIFAAHFLREWPHNPEIGSRGPQFSLIDNAKLVVIEYSPALKRAGSQVSQIASRPSSSIRTAVDLKLHDPEFAGTPCSDRRVFVLDSVARS